ncbi:Sporulation kinase E [Anaerohalosphaera lusitana]|uniref:histidine kinase n=1 Tax=Anaerohalosphaera lusitana TaxID=1936003 RepID=A0A1U9NM57_9BACT|nr:PAS domain S-box protein [Anaerohalosphaera lusitana]AQT68993.1 Sporulation kinase E [Anaerohalosphaera lusitana]
MAYLGAKPHVILIVEDDRLLARLMEKRLHSAGHKVKAVYSGKSAIQYVESNLSKKLFMIADYQLGDMTASQLVCKLSAINSDVPFIVATGQGSEQVAVEMMKLGALDYLIKDGTFLDLLPLVVSQGIRNVELEGKLASTEQALRQEKTHLLNNIPDLVFQIDREGLLRSLNPAMFKKLGYSSEELSGKCLFEFCDPQSQKGVRADYASVMEGSQLSSHILRLVDKAGSTKWLEGNVVPIRDEPEGGISGASAIYHDITAQKLASEALREAEQRYRLLVENSPTLVVELDNNNNRVRLNSKAHDFFGVQNAGDISGRELLEKMPESWHGPLLEAVKKAPEGISKRMTLPWYGKNNSKQWYELDVSPLAGAEGAASKTLITAWNVTHRVSKEIEYAESLRAQHKSAREAKILQQIAFSVDLNRPDASEGVLDLSTKLLCRHLGAAAGVGYFFDDNGFMIRAGQKGSIPLNALERLDDHICSRRMVGKLARTRGPRLVSNLHLVPGDAGDIEYRGRSGLSTCILPLRHGRRVQGAILLVAGHKELTSHTDFLRSAADCIGITIANSRSYQKAKKQLSNIGSSGETMVDESRSRFDDSRNPDELVSVIASGVHAVKAEGGIVLLYDKKRDVLESAANYSKGDQGMNVVMLSRHNNAVWQCYEAGKPELHVKDQDNTQVLPSAVRRLADSSVLIMPLKDGNENVGVFILLDVAAEFYDSAMYILGAFTKLAIQAIQNRRLFSRAESFRENITSIRDCARRMERSTDTAEILRSFSDTARIAVKASIAGAATYSHAEGKYTAGEYACKLKDGRPSSKLEGLLNQGKYFRKVSNEAHVISDPEIAMHLFGNEGDYGDCICAPVTYSDDILGVLLLCFENGTIVNRQDIMLAEETARLLAVTLNSLRLNRRLLASERLKDIILHTVHEPLLVIDLKGMVVTVNDAASKLFGKSRDAFENLYYAEVPGFDTALAKPVKDWLKGANEEGQSHGIANDYDDNELFLALESRTITIENTRCLLVSITDMTQQRKMNETLEHKDKLSSLGRMAAQIAHEVGNPLALISSRIQRLTEKEEIDKNDLAGVLPHVDRISGLIKRMSDLGRPNVPAFDRCKLSSIVNNVITLAGYTDMFEKVELKTVIVDESPVVECDAGKVTQILLNLLMNAAQACEMDGEVTVGVKYRRLPIEEADRERFEDFAVITVSDNGKGMTEETQEHIFEPFYTQRQDGAGLGLSVSMSIMRQHQGWISVESTLGKGAVFTLFLPMKQNDREKVEGGSKRRIGAICYESKTRELNQRN